MPYISAKPGIVRGTGLSGMAVQVAKQPKAPAFRRPSTERNPFWRDEAACADVNPDLFFGLDGERAHDKAKREKIAADFCRTACPVMFACRSWAIQSGQEAGAWGGLGEDERRTAKRRIARAKAKDVMQA